MTRRRKLKSNTLKILFLFGFVTAFTFLSLKIPRETDAASLDKFDPGNIITDYMMSKVDTMSVADIDSFLHAKGNCNNTNTYLANNYPHLSYHIENGHFVCLADERFGNGTEIGSGQTAAEVIYEVAHEYNINPQVLIVLLQKEQGLITDSWPNNIQYRSATGFGCPDTAACDSKYYGFKNQLKNAAALFRTVLDGGWTNYPVGENYIYYNPDRNCGGSTVNIKNRATSSLYRYTPYQPNAGALAAGYGTTTCGAYGNRNFYLYFMDWFGDPTKNNSWVSMENARYLETTKTDKINPFSNEILEVLENGKTIKFTSKILIGSGEWCLRTEYDTKNSNNSCVPLSKLKEITLKYEKLPAGEQYKLINVSSEKTYIKGESTTIKFSKGAIRRFTKKTTFNGKTYYITEFDDKNTNGEYGIEKSYLSKTPEYEDFLEPRYMVINQSTDRINTFTGDYYDTLPKGKIIKFTTKIKIGNTWYYRTEHNSKNNIDAIIEASNLSEAPKYENFSEPRQLVVNKTTNRINPFTGDYYDTLPKSKIIKFTTKIKIGNTWYYRTEHNSKNNIDAVVEANALREL